MEQEKIGKFISELRKQKKLTQEELAARLSVSSKTVSRWETGSNMPDYSLLPLLSEILGVSINDLLSGEISSKENYQSNFEKNVINTIDKIEKKNKKAKKSIIITITVLILAIFIGTYFGYKAIYLYYYSNDKYTVAKYINFKENLKEVLESNTTDLIINARKLADDEYVTQGNIKFIDSFNYKAGLEKYMEEQDKMWEVLKKYEGILDWVSSSPSYEGYTYTNEFEDTFIMTNSNNYSNDSTGVAPLFGNAGITLADKKISEKEVEKFNAEKHFKTYVELYKYIVESQTANNLFMNINKIKENYMIESAVNYLYYGPNGGRINKITNIKGDLEGEIIEFAFASDSELIVKMVRIYKNDTIYGFFFRSNRDYFSDELVKEFLETLVIE